MAVSKSEPVPKINVTIDEKPIKQVQKMIYLGHMATEKGNSETEIKRRISIAKATFASMTKVLTSREVSLDTRLKM